MAGRSEPASRLNTTLKKAIEFCNDLDTDNWFIMYGTLLGVARNRSCIEGDDDVDIFISYDFEQLKSKVVDAGFTLSRFTSPKGMVKTNHTDQYASIDFYMCSVTDDDWYTPWERTWLRKVDIKQMDFQGVPVNVPNNVVSRLTQMYGVDWKTPRRGKKVGRDKEIK